ncbi:MAG: hypothetical protein IJW70_03995 [Clostridia bacterium]|nr:hypothetical protein [Clostridia bacterium]
MKAPKSLCLLLALSMLLLTMVGCSNTPDDLNVKDDSSNTSVDEEPSEAPSEPTVRERIEALPDCTYTGEEFHILASSSFQNSIYIAQFPEYDTLTGSLVDDELFNRDAMLEEIFGLDLVWDDVLDSQMYAGLNNDIQAGNDTVGLVLGSLAYVAFPMLNGGVCYDLNTVPNIDLTAPHWNKNTVDNFEINDKVFFATGAITNRSVYSAFSVLFNEKLLDDAGLETPYALIERNEWTIETFAEMIEGTYVDLNGNDEMDILDFYGYAPGNDSENAHYFGAGGSYIKKNENDELTLTYTDEGNTNIMEYVIDLFYDDGVMRYTALADSITAFKECRALFHTLPLCDITLLSDMSDPYGFAPTPKLDEDQQDYYTHTNRFISTMAIIPISVQDTTNAGLITEALATASLYTSMEAQYENVMLSRQARDDNASAVLKMLVESSNFDLCHAFDLAGLYAEMIDVINGTSDKSYSTVYASLEDKMNTELEEFLAHFE